MIMALLFWRNRNFKGNMKLLAVFLLTLTVMTTMIRGRNVFYFLSIFPFVFIPFSDRDFTKSTYRNFLNIYCLIIFFSLVVWIFVISGMPLRLGTIAPLNVYKSYSYIHYPLLVRIPDSYRFEGVFDEPGVVGTLSGMMLCIQKFNLRDKRNIILFFSGLCSMSMFFYLMLVAYLVLFYVTKKKSIWKAIIVVLLTFGVFSIIQNVPILYEIIGSRLEWNADEMQFEGDNRTSDFFMDYLLNIWGTSEFWLGVNDMDGFLDSVRGQCNVYMTIIVNGVLFCSLYLVYMIAYGLHFRKTWSSFSLFMFVFLTCVYQRPFLFDAIFIFLWSYMARLETMEDMIVPKKEFNTQ